MNIVKNMAKLPWNPPKWRSYTLDGSKFKVELETGEVYTGHLNATYINMAPNHPAVCEKIFGMTFVVGHANELNELSRVLDLGLRYGNWPEYFNVPEFLKTYYERVAKIEKPFTKSIISIESEIEITPKFTL